MTLKDAIFEVKVLTKRGVTSISLDEATIKILVNSALQWAYPYAMQWDPSFYVRTHTFGATTSLAKSGISGFNRLLFIQTPTATFGAARISHFTEADEIENNPYLLGTTDWPHAWEEQTVLEIRPSIAGTVFYLFKFGEVASLTYNITALGDPTNPALIPWAWEKAVILKAVVLARERHLKQAEIGPGDMVQRIKAYQDAVDALKIAMMPLNRTAAMALSPAYPLPQQQQANG